MSFKRNICLLLLLLGAMGIQGRVLEEDNYETEISWELEDGIASAGCKCEKILKAIEDICPKYDGIASAGCKCEKIRKAVEDICPKYALSFFGENINDYVISDDSTPTMDAFTVCFWVKTNQTGDLAHFVSYATSEHNNEIIIIYQNDLKVQLLEDNNSQHQSRSHNIQVKDGKWHHICLTWKSEGGNYIFYKDGSHVGNGSLSYSKEKTIRGGGLWVLGWDQDRLGGGFSIGQAFKGEMLEVNVWNRVLLPKDISRMSNSCREEQKGNVMSWKDFEEGVKGNVPKVEATC